MSDATNEGISALRVDKDGYLWYRDKKVDLDKLSMLLVKLEENGLTLTKEEIDGQINENIDPKIQRLENDIDDLSALIVALT